MSLEPPTGSRERVFRTIAIVCLVLLVISIVMLVVGDPVWNLYVVSLGLFVAPPVGLIAVGLLIRSRRRSSAGS